MAKGSKKVDFDPYKVLQLEYGCEPGLIDKAYKKQALRWHPDKNPDDPEKAQKMFLRIYEAYEFLKDERTRMDFDEDIAAKRRRAEFEAERQSVSSAQRKVHLAKLREAEAKVVAGQKRKSDQQNAQDKLIEELRREGQRVMQRLREAEEERQRRAQKQPQQQQRPTTTPSASRQLRQEVDELEKALFGGTVL
uniref:J domain-containing protein n=1 Tax=Globodera pallida TaxID=36090 RepID=A0A183C4F6_GLOPA